MINPEKFGLASNIPVTFLTPEQSAKIPGTSSGYNAVYKIGDNRVRYELLKAGKFLSDSPQPPVAVVEPQPTEAVVEDVPVVPTEVIEEPVAPVVEETQPVVEESTPVEPVVEDTPVAQPTTKKKK